MRSIRSVYDDLTLVGKDLVDQALLQLIKEEHHLSKIALNLNYIVQVLSLKKSATKETTFIKLFETVDDHLLKRQIIVTLANWQSDYWLADIRQHFNSFTLWEK